MTARTRKRGAPALLFLYGTLRRMLENIKEIAIAYPLLAPLLFVLLRSVPVIIPPIPGVGFDLLGIALFGWQYGLILALLGGHLGSVIAFYLARRHRAFVARHVHALSALHALEEQYSERQKFWTLVGVRFMTSPLFDYVNYIAGLTKMSFSKYLLSTFIGIFPYAFCIYYFGQRMLQMGWVYAVFAFVGLLILLSLFQDRIMRHFSKIQSNEKVL